MRCIGFGAAAGSSNNYILAIGAEMPALWGLLPHAQAASRIPASSTPPRFNKAACSRPRPIFMIGGVHPDRPATRCCWARIPLPHACRAARLSRWMACLPAHYAATYSLRFLLSGRAGQRHFPCGLIIVPLHLLSSASRPADLFPLRGRQPLLGPVLSKSLDSCAPSLTRTGRPCPPRGVPVWPASAALSPVLPGNQHRPGGSRPSNLELPTCLSPSLPIGSRAHFRCRHTPVLALGRPLLAALKRTTNHYTRQR
jgi:hypothetical protein